MDAQTQLVAELYKTLNDAQKQEVCNMIDTLLSQQLNDQQSLDSHSAATENQDNPMPTTVPTPGVTIEPMTAPSSAHSTTINSERSCDLPPCSSSPSAKPVR